MIERLQGVSMLWRQTTSVVVRGLGRAFVFALLSVCLLFPPPSFGYDFVIGGLALLLVARSVRSP